MKTFEYDILSFAMTRKTSLADMQASLDAKRPEDWEAVSISSSAFAYVGHTVFLKRETTTIGATA